MGCASFDLTFAMVHYLHDDDLMGVFLKPVMHSAAEHNLALGMDGLSMVQDLLVLAAIENERTCTIDGISFTRTQMHIAVYLLISSRHDCLQHRGRIGLDQI